jgi:hypothetical protein
VLVLVDAVFRARIYYGSPLRERALPSKTAPYDSERRIFAVKESGRVRRQEQAERGVLLVVVVVLLVLFMHVGALVVGMLLCFAHL